MDFNQYYKTSKKLELRKYARKVPNLSGTYYNYSLGLDNYDKEPNCTIGLRKVDYNYAIISSVDYIDIYAPSVFDETTVTLAYNPYKDYMFEIWGEMIFLKGKQIGKIPDSAFRSDDSWQAEFFSEYVVYKDFKFYDPFATERKHNLASISEKKLKKYRNKLDNSLNTLIHDYVEVYELSPYASSGDKFTTKYHGWRLTDYTDITLKRDVNKKVLGEFDNIDSLKDFLIKKNLKSKKIDEDETLVDLIEDYFVRTHIMKINSKYYIDYYDVIPSGYQYRRALELQSEI